MAAKAIEELRSSFTAKFEELDLKIVAQGESMRLMGESMRQMMAAFFEKVEQKLESALPSTVPAAHKVFEERSPPKSRCHVETQGAEGVSEEKSSDLLDASGLIATNADFCSMLQAINSVREDVGGLGDSENTTLKTIDNVIEPIQESEFSSFEAGIQLVEKAEQSFPSKQKDVKTANQLFDEMPKPSSMKIECHHLFDEMPILFSVKENDKSKGREKLGLQVAEMSRVLSFKEDASETSKFVFDPGGSYWLHNGCDSFGFTDDKQHFDKFSANYSQNELGKGWQESWPKVANELGLLPLMLKLAAQVQRQISCPLVNTGFKMLLKVVLELHSQQNGLFPKPKLNKRQVVFQIHGFGKIGILNDLIIQKEPAHIDYNDNNLLLMKKGHVFEYSNRDGHEFGLVRIFPMDNLLFVQSSTQRKIAGDGSIQNLSAEPDKEVAIVVMDFLIPFKIGTETKFDPARWLENYLLYIRLFSDAIQIDRGRATYLLSKTFNVANLIHFPQSAIRLIPVVLHIDDHKLIWNALKQLAAKILFSLVTFWAFGCLHLADAVNANVLNVELWLELYKAFQIEIQAAFCTVTSWIAVIAMVALDVIMAVVPYVMEIEDCSLVINVENFIWDPGWCVVFFYEYILGDKDVFEREGKRMVCVDDNGIQWDMIMRYIGDNEI